MDKFNQDADNNIDHHVTPFSTYIKVASALFALTILTVTAHQMHLGVLAAPVAFLIATIKAVLVLLWFMHLKDDNYTNRVIFGSAFFFLVVLYTFCATDIATRVFESSSL
jgi:cytochrome c oxidase subunit 4